MNLPATELPAKGLVGQKCDLSDANLAPFNPRPTTSPALPFGYRNLPTLRKDKKLISISYRQMTPWCRDMYNWFTPDPTMGVWLETECIDCYRIHACKERLKTQRVFPIQTGLIPGYSGHVPGQKFRLGSACWTTETKNARRIGVQRPWISTTLAYFENRSIGP